MRKKIYLELYPFESGILLGVLIKEINTNPDCKDCLDKIARRLCDSCQEEYYEDSSDD